VTAALGRAILAALESGGHVGRHGAIRPGVVPVSVGLEKD